MAAFVHLLRPEDVPSIRQKHAMLKHSAKPRHHFSKLAYSTVLYRSLSAANVELTDSDLGPNLYFSSVPKQPRKKRKLGIHPAPAPDPQNYFQFHTPPSSPSVPCKTNPTERLNGPSPKAFSSPKPQGQITVDENFGEFFGGAFLAGSLLDQPRGSEPSVATVANPPMPAGDAWQGDDDLTFEIREKPSKPDQSQIKAKVDRYYPLVVGQYAPAPDLPCHCFTQGCTQAQDVYYSCVDCTRVRWYCQKCIVDRHRDCALHRVEQWDNLQGCKSSTSLGALGLVLQFDHPNGHPCSCTSADRPIEVLTVLHTNGQHKILYRVCPLRSTSFGRHTATPEQLLANRFFPATDDKPEQAFTFDLLQHYDVLDLYSFINIKQFCDGMLAMGPESSDVSLFIVPGIGQPPLPGHFNETITNLITRRAADFEVASIAPFATGDSSV
jgi:hypothetical protein